MPPSVVAIALVDDVLVGGVGERGLEGVAITLISGVVEAAATAEQG